MLKRLITFIILVFVYSHSATINNTYGTKLSTCLAWTKSVYDNLKATHLYCVNPWPEYKPVIDETGINYKRIRQSAQDCNTETIYCYAYDIDLPECPLENLNDWRCTGEPNPDCANYKTCSDWNDIFTYQIAKKQMLCPSGKTPNCSERDTPTGCPEAYEVDLNGCTEPCGIMGENPNDFIPCEEPNNNSSSSESSSSETCQEIVDGSWCYICNESNSGYWQPCEESSSSSSSNDNSSSSNNFFNNKNTDQSDFNDKGIILAINDLKESNLQGLKEVNNTLESNHQYWEGQLSTDDNYSYGLEERYDDREYTREDVDFNPEEYLNTTSSTPVNVSEIEQNINNSELVNQLNNLNITLATGCPDVQVNLGAMIGIDKIWSFCDDLKIGDSHFLEIIGTIMLIVMIASWFLIVLR